MENMFDRAPRYTPLNAATDNEIPQGRGKECEDV